MLRDACGDCGSPLFRYQGRVVCAACGEAKDDDASEEGTGSLVSGVADGEDGGGTAPDEGEVEGEDGDGDIDRGMVTGTETKTEEGYRGNTTVDGVREGEREEELEGALADEDGEGGDLGEVDAHLRSLAGRLARDAARSADDPDDVERRLDALERVLGILDRD